MTHNGTTRPTCGQRLDPCRSGRRRTTFAAGAVAHDVARDAQSTDATTLCAAVQCGDPPPQWNAQTGPRVHGENEPEPDLNEERL